MPVVVATAEQRQVPITVGVIGTVQAYSTVSVRSQVDGQIVASFFKEGQPVKQGDLLFTIDPRPYQAQLAQEQAALARDQARLEGARKDLERTQQLSKQGVSSRQLLDQAIANERAAAATVKADEATVQMAQLQLNYTSIHSPIDGRTGSLLVNVGNLVMANGSSALLTIHQVQPIYVTFSVPEKYLPEIKRRMVDGPLRVTAKIPGDSGPPEVGQVDFVSNAVDTTTGTIQLRGTFANSVEDLTPGQLVDTVLTLHMIEKAVTVPDSAIQNSQRGTAVFAVKSDMTVELRPVRVGVSDKGYTVVEDGLAVGDSVVVEGQLRLAPGTKVRAVDAAPAVAATPSM